MSDNTQAFHIRPATANDLEQVVALDERISGAAKKSYWEEIYTRQQTRRSKERFFYVAEDLANNDTAIAGFIIGEVRTWEFGSATCGWVFAISVDPSSRLSGIGTALFDTISQSFEKLGVYTIRTMVSRNNHELLSFFRSEGLTSGPYLQLEKELD